MKHRALWDNGQTYPTTPVKGSAVFDFFRKKGNNPEEPAKDGGPQNCQSSSLQAPSVVALTKAVPSSPSKAFEMPSA